MRLACSLHDVDVSSDGKLFDVHGLIEQPIKEVFFGNAKVKCAKIGELTDVQSFSLKDVTVDSPEKRLMVDGCDLCLFLWIQSSEHRKAY